MLSNVVDPTANAARQSKLFVGPTVKHDSEERLKESRPAVDSTRAVAMAQGLWHQFQSMPVDYEFWFKEAAEICPRADAMKVGASMAQLDFGVLSSDDATPTQKMQVIGELTSWLPCAADYFRADIEGSHSFGPFESMGYLHAIVEFGYTIFHQGWNDLAWFCNEVKCNTASTVDAGNNNQGTAE